MPDQEQLQPLEAVEPQGDEIEELQEGVTGESPDLTAEKAEEVEDEIFEIEGKQFSGRELVEAIRERDELKSKVKQPPPEPKVPQAGAPPKTRQEYLAEAVDRYAKQYKALGLEDDKAQALAAVQVQQVYELTAPLEYELEARREQDRQTQFYRGWQARYMADPRTADFRDPESMDYALRMDLAEVPADEIIFYLDQRKKRLAGPTAEKKTPRIRRISPHREEPTAGPQRKTDEEDDKALLTGARAMARRLAGV